ncbi:MAG: indolepyruvate oxidoreductase subunit beta [Tissierellia bacterium]|nr:indolepyruvate oxidoreductase subunit beta [Tissierellia bacterium]
MKNISILIVGVGGQGTLLTSRILGSVAMELGYDVKMSELHGMSQRGGSVVTYVKMGEKVYSPIIEEQEADIILAFEELEGIRWNRFLKKDGMLVLNTQQIDPMPVITRKASYPENITEKLQNAYSNTILINALDIAKKLGNVKVVNVIMLGKIAKVLELDEELFFKAIETSVPAKFLDLNKKAFAEGYNS